MFKKLLLAIGLSFLSVPAFAACTDPLTILNSVSASINMSVSQNTADAGCMYNVTPNQGGAPLSATNGWYTNILQGNAVLSAANGLYVNVGLGNAANAAANPFFVSPGTGAVFQVQSNSANLATAANQSTEISSLATIAANTGASVPAGTNVIGFTSNDPCNQATKKTVPVSQAASGIVITHTTGQKTYVCGGVLVAGAAEIVGFEEGTGTVCATGTTVLAGSSTTANGMSLAANGGFKVDPIFATAAASDDVCLVQNGTSRVAGWLTYVQQ